MCAATSILLAKRNARLNQFMLLEQILLAGAGCQTDAAGLHSGSLFLDHVCFKNIPTIARIDDICWAASATIPPVRCISEGTASPLSRPPHCSPPQSRARGNETFVAIALQLAWIVQKQKTCSNQSRSYLPVCSLMKT